MLHQQVDSLGSSTPCMAQVQAVMAHFRTTGGQLGPEFSLQLQPDAAAMLAQMSAAMVRCWLCRHLIAPEPTRGVLKAACDMLSLGQAA